MLSNKQIGVRGSLTSPVKSYPLAMCSFRSVDPVSEYHKRTFESDPSGIWFVALTDKQNYNTVVEITLSKISFLFEIS